MTQRSPKVTCSGRYSDGMSRGKNIQGGVHLQNQWNRIPSGNSSLVIFPSDECHCTSLILCQHWSIVYLWTRFDIMTTFPGMGIPMFKIRQSWNCLIFNMGIPILVRQHLYTETAPWCHLIVLGLLVNIGLGNNGLSPAMHQAITWTNADKLSTGILRTIIGEIWYKWNAFHPPLPPHTKKICICKCYLQNNTHFV